MALLLVVSSSVVGQSVQGRVSDSTGIAPPIRVLVVGTVVESGQRIVAMTDARGAFDLRLSSAARISLSVHRIGYRPEGPVIVDVPVGGLRDVRLRFPTFAVVLPEVRVTAGRTCGAPSGAAGELWAEAQSALYLARESERRPLDVEWITFDREFDARGTSVVRQTFDRKRASTPRAFRSAPAAALATQGFVVEVGDGVEFFAPDAETLLAPEFAASHCYALRRGTAERPSLVGLAFMPREPRRGYRDVEGTFWVDARTSRLSRLEYTYTNLPRSLEAGAGGTVEYAALEDGRWLVTAWSIRMPIVTLPKLDADRRVVRRSSAGVLSGIAEAGGRLLSVAEGSSELLRTADYPVRVQVSERASRAARAGVEIAASDLHLQATSGADGYATLRFPLPGTHTISVITDAMRAWHLPAIERQIDVRGEGAVVTVEVPSDAEVPARACSTETEPSHRGALQGRAVDSLGAGVSAVIVARWISDLSGARAAMASLRVVARSASARSDSTGWWLLCGLPIEQAIRVFAETPTLVGDTAVTLAPTGSLSAIPVVLFAKPLSVTNGGRYALAKFRVRDDGGGAVAGARVRIVEPVGYDRELRTDSLGEITHAVPLLGPVRVAVEAIGFVGGTVDLELRSGLNTIQVRLDRADIPVLDAVRVTAISGAGGRLTSFERRRRAGATTASFTAEEIAFRKFTSIVELLRQVPSVSIHQGDFGTAAASSRAIITSLRDPGAPCWFRVALDGVPLSGNPVDLRSLPEVPAIGGVEVFGGAASVPPEFGSMVAGAWCGLVMVWTK